MWPLDPQSRELAQAWWAAPEPRPVAAPRAAATVVLVRERPTGIEVFVLQRHHGMRFAPGMTVFPGGGVDPGDADVERAAVRELFEETGVLLASGADGGFPDTDTAAWRARRQAVETRASSLSEVLSQARLTSRPDLMVPWSRWVTPEFLPIRYDTWFFVAQLPPGQRARHVAGEAVAASWVRPAELWDDPASRLMPPTRATLIELAGAASWDEVLAGAPALGAGAQGVRRVHQLEPRLSHLRVVDGQFGMEQPPPLNDLSPPGFSSEGGVAGRPGA